MPIAKVDSRERPLNTLGGQAGFDVSIVVYIFPGIIIIEFKRADLEIDKKRAEYQKQANPYFGTNIKIICFVNYTHRSRSTLKKIFLLLVSGSLAIALFQCR
jgi:hypothetical protein